MTRIHTIHKEQMFRHAVALVLALFLWLSFLMPIGRASTQKQTIPTAPPPTTTATQARAPTHTQPNPPQQSATAPQATQVIASQTEGATAAPATSSPGSATVRAVTSSPSGLPSETRLPGNGTIPQLTDTLIATEGTLSVPSSTQLPTATGIAETQTPGASGLLAYLIGFGVGVVLLMGVRAWLKRRKR